MSKVSCTSIYTRMMKNLDKGRGIHLSAEELWHIYTFDNAVMTIIENVRDGTDLETGDEDASHSPGGTDD